MRLRLILFSVFCFLFSVLAGCDQFNVFWPKKATKETKSPYALAVKGTIIAKVNNMPITLEELRKYVDIFNASIDMRQDLAPEQKTQLKIGTRDKQITYLKDVLIRQRVFYQAALDRGLDRKEEIVDILEKDRIAILAKTMEEEVIKNIDVSSAEIEDAYNRSKEWFKEPETRKIREIKVRNEEEARQILIELLQGGDFAAIARNRSLAESAKNGGDLGELQVNQRGDEFIWFDNVAFSPTLQKGSLSSVFKGPDGYYILKIEDIKGGKQYTLSEVWDTIKLLLLNNKQQKALDDYFNQLKSSDTIRIEFYESEIK